MSILNRRNAVIGWSVWQVGKRVVTRKAKTSTWRRASPYALALVAAAAAAAAAVWLKRRSDDTVDSYEPPA